MDRDRGITFLGDDGTRWTVLPVRAGRVLGAGPVGLMFTSESGEQRIASGYPCEPEDWPSTDAVTWRALLERAVLVT